MARANPREGGILFAILGVLSIAALVYLMELSALFSTGPTRAYFDWVNRTLGL